MKVPFVDLQIQYQTIKPEIDAAVQDVLDSAAFIMGPKVAEFEQGFARLHSAAYCIGTSSGTDSLHLALWAAGIQSGDAVIIPVNTFIATAEAVSLCGAEPVFIDCDEYYNLDVSKLKQKLSALRAKEWARLKGIIPVHLYGQPADMDEIAALAREYDLVMIEDCAQAHCAQWNGRPVGTFGLVGCFSFYPGKNLGAYGEAGAVITNDRSLYEAMMLIHDHGARIRYHHHVIGHNYRMEGIQGAVLSVKLNYINSWTEKRRENANLYGELLKDVVEVAIPKIKPGRTHSFHLYVVRVKERDALMKYLTDHGISTGLHYPVPLHLQKAYAHLGYRRGDFPMAEKMAGEILSLPMYPELTKEQINYVVNQIKNFFGKRR
ncbi:MAG: DegT/DnrJ/EryC1/StrS family aminotransferase [bacterium]